MDHAAAHELRACLARDEKLLWSGRPDPLRYAMVKAGRGLALGAPLTLVVLAAMIALALGLGPWEPRAATRWLMIGICVPALFIGLRTLLAPLEHFREARHVAYGLTDRRAVVLIGGSRSRIVDVEPSRYLAAEVKNHGNGTATVLFFDSARVPRAGVAQGRGGFVGIRDATALRTLIEARIAERDRPETTRA